MAARRGRAWFIRVLCWSAAVSGVADSALAGTARLIERPDLGVTVIHFEGQIVKGDLKRIQALVPKAKSANPANQVFVSFHSGGGHAWEGTDIGNYLRAQGIGTILLPNATCASACTFAFWGGFDAQAQKPRRIAMPGARLGVHRIYLTPERYPKGSTIDANAALEFLQKRVAYLYEYLSHMEVAPEVQRRMFSTNSKDIYFLTEDEIRASKIARIERVSGAWMIRDAELEQTLMPPLVRGAQTSRLVSQETLPPDRHQIEEERRARALEALPPINTLPAFGFRIAAPNSLVGEDYNPFLVSPLTGTLINFFAPRPVLVGAYPSLKDELQAQPQDAAAMNNLGALYEKGEGRPQDYVEARHWYEKAAALGHARAMINLGDLYSNGRGVRQDYDEARHWYERAAALGEPRAMFNLGELYRYGVRVEKSTAQAWRWYKRAADLGEPNAMLNLAILYTEGQGGHWGIIQDPGEAQHWFEKAAALGNEQAKQILAKSKRLGH